jgi:hypothetical protein
MTKLCRTLPLLAALLFVPVAQAVAAPQHDHDHQSAAPVEKAQGGSMKMDCMQSAGMQAMAAKKKANTERIDALMAKIKSSSGEAKVAAMADVIAVLLEERAAMGEACGKK